MNNINFATWATISFIQLLALNVYYHKIVTLEAKAVSLSQRMDVVEADLNQQVDELVKKQIISYWEAEDEYDSR